MEKIPPTEHISLADRIGQIITRLSDECQYKVHLLGGHSPETGHLKFQPLIDFYSPSAPVGKNYQALSITQLTAYAEALQADLKKNGLPASVQMETYPSCHIVVQFSEPVAAQNR